MKYDFDAEIDRRGTNSIKWEFAQDPGDPERWLQTERSFGEDRLLPMWVADMDFRSPQPVIEALVARAQHGIYGYSAPDDGFYRAIVDWMARRHNWEIDPRWICLTPGVVPALNLLVRTFVPPGERVLIQPPVYFPFFSAVENNGAELVHNPLIYEGGRYRMDYADLERKAADPRVKMAILGSPHNPVGRVWSPEELKRFGEICLANDVLVVSDEIHGDLIHRGHTFTPFASLGPEFAGRSITCTAPSKTFNTAGLQLSTIIIPDDGLRAGFRKILRRDALVLVGAFGIVALQAGYEHGEEWLEQLIDYLGSNVEFLEAYMAEHIPQISVIRPEGTYLVWLDCRRLGLDKLELQRLFMDEARVFLEEGFIFGPQGDGFARINIACPRRVLAEALERIKAAIRRLPDRAREETSH